MCLLSDPLRSSSQVGLSSVGRLELKDAILEWVLGELPGAFIGSFGIHTVPYNILTMQHTFHIIKDYS